MAVYTQVNEEDMISFLNDYDLGTLIGMRGIAEGVENSNYLITLQQNHDEDVRELNYILTLFEKRVRKEDLPFFMGLMTHLSHQGVNCPLPIADRHGQVEKSLNGRPATITSFLSGISRRKPQITHCGALGKALADMHVACKGFALTRENLMGISSWRSLLNAAGEGIDALYPNLFKLLHEELDDIEAKWPKIDAKGLNRGICHADLFPDNVFFLGDDVSGIIDFYFACEDFHSLDLAITLNSWCFEPDGDFNLTKARNLLTNYHAIRPLSDEEQAYFVLFARGAAMRFLLSRLYDWLNTPKDALVKPHDPLIYWKILCFHRKINNIRSYGIGL